MAIELVLRAPASGCLPLTQHLSANGDGTGAINANGIYTEGTDDGVFFIQPPAGVIFFLSRIFPFIQDTNIQAELYGNVDLETAGNGILMQAGTGGTVDWDVLAGVAVKSNADWSHHMFDVNYQEFGQGDEVVVGRLTFTRMGGFLRLDGDAGEWLRVVCQDTLSGLVAHAFVVQGIRYPKKVRTRS